MESSCFELFGDWKYGLFFESRSWWKDDIYWLLRSSCFELFSDGKYGIFFSQKVDGKMIFTWSFLSFYDIPGRGKYGFSRSVYYVLFSYIYIHNICIALYIYIHRYIDIYLYIYIYIIYICIYIYICFICTLFKVSTKYTNNFQNLK